MPPFTPPPATGTSEPVVPTSPVTAPPPARRSGSGTLLNALLVLAVAVAVGGVAFAAGRATALAAASTTGRLNNGFVGGGVGPQGSFAPGASFVPGQGGFRGGLFGAGGAFTLSGTVTKVDASGVTIKTANGEEITVGTDGSTTYHAATAAVAGDVEAGATVDVKVAGGPGGFGQGGGNAGNGAAASPGTTTTRTVTAADITVHD